MAYGGVNLPSVSVPEFNTVKEIAHSADGLASEIARTVHGMQAQIETLEESAGADEVAIGELMHVMRGVTDRIEAHETVVLTASLTNSEAYPFNDSITTLAFGNSQTRSTTDYSVTFYVVSSTGGFVGDIIVSDKMLNGFKVEYTGSATAATIKCFVQGGR